MSKEMSKKWLIERKKDIYYKEAKERGYRSRASYKLKQINTAYKIIKRGSTVIDLGCAPGGWSQVAKEIVCETGRVIGIDIEEIEPIDGVIFIRGDITEDKTLDKVKDLLEGRRVDAVISDLSPKISGNYSIDHARSIFLSERALEFAERFLKVKGNFLVKVFQGDMFREFFRKVGSEFRAIKAHSPKASRPSSSEIYIIAKGFKGKEQ